MATQLVEKRELLAARQKELATIFAEAKTENGDLDFGKVASLTGDAKARVEEVQRRNTELDGLFDEVKRLHGLQEMESKVSGMGDFLAAPANGARGAIAHPEGGAAGATPPQKSLTDLLLDSVTVKEFQPAAKRGPVSEHKYDWMQERKTVLTETGFAPQAIRTGLILPAALQQPRIADLIPQGTTDQTAIVYMEETTTTNAVAGTLEGNLKPESALAFTERNSPVRKIAGILPVTDELLNDVPALRSYVEMRLRLFLALAEDRDLYAGAGSPTLTGLTNISGIQTQARGTDPGPDAIFKAMVKVYTGAYLQASGIVMHPIDWQNIRLLRTDQGIYIFGNPGDNAPARLWGLNVVTTTAATQGTALVAAFDTAVQIFRRDQVSFAISTEHSDFFARNEMLLRVEERLALVCYRPAAIVTVSGL